LDSGSPLEAAFGRLLFCPHLSRRTLGLRGGHLKNVLIAVLLALCALPGHAAEKKKQWMRLDGCQYVPDKSNDGDSFLVQCGREKFHARLYFVDCPETEMSFPERVHQQAGYFGVTMDEAMRSGARARDFVGATLRARPFVIYTKKAFAQGRSKATRYYSLVAVDGRYLHEILLSEGLARNKGTIVALPTGEKARAYAGALQKLEDRARQGRLGTWAASDPNKRVAPF
jgi:endonuclease YncB( thermonuclease family)